MLLLLDNNYYNSEYGWKRYDDSDAKIKHGSGVDLNLNDSRYYNRTYTQINTNPSTNWMSFNFTGTKLRIIGRPTNICDTKANVIIDGKTYNYNAAAGPEASILAFEKLGLENKEHFVTINTHIGTYAIIDAIDIDSVGELKSYNENTSSSISLDKSVDNLQVGETDNLVATTTPAGATVSWASSDSSIATVDSIGKVTALKEGQAVITATTADGLTATCAVTVTTKTAEPTNPDPDPTDSDKIVNIAHAKGDNTNNAGGDVTIIFHGAADTTLSVIKTADVKDVWVGDNFTYTIVVTNTGTKTAKAVVVNDPAPNHIDFVVNGITTTQGTVDPSSTSKNIIVNVGDIAPGATVTIKIPATVVL